MPPCDMDRYARLSRLHPEQKPDGCLVLLGRRVPGWGKKPMRGSRVPRVEINLLKPRPLFDMWDPIQEYVRAIAVPLHFKTTPPWVRMVPVYGIADRFAHVRVTRPDWFRVTPRKVAPEPAESGVSKVVMLPGPKIR